MAKDLYYKVGAVKTEITPPVDIPYLGFYPRHCSFKDIHDRLFARTLVIGDGENKIAIVDIDSIGFDNSLLGKDRDFSKELREKICEKTGIPAYNIMLCAAHIHSTPDTLNFRPLIESESAETWLEILMEKIAVSVVEADRISFRACMKTIRGNVDGISANRRGTACLDTEMTVILFNSLESKDYVLIVNYACHPVIMQVQDMISADFVGVMQDSVEKAIKDNCFCLFLQGACGDINPIVNDSRSFDDVESTGLALAGEVMRLYAMMSFKDYAKQPVFIKAVNKKMRLASRRLPTSQEQQSIFQRRDEHRQKESLTVDEVKELAELDEFYYRLIEGAGYYDAEAQVFRIGDCIVSAFSGELFCETGLAIKEWAYPLIGIPVCYANGYIGYVAPKGAWEKGGYEVKLGMWSKVGPESLETVEDSIRSLIDGIK